MTRTKATPLNSKSLVRSTGTSDTHDFPESMLEFLGFRLYRTAWLLRDRIDSEFREYKIKVQQFGLLSVLAASGPMSQADLGGCSCIDKASMVKFVAGLEKLSYITREEDEVDRRVRIVTITPLGKKVLKTLSSIRHEVEKDFMRQLNEKEQSALKHTLLKLLSANQALRD